MLKIQEHNIYISHNLKASLDDVLNASNYSKIAVIVDENTEEHCLPILQPLLPSGTGVVRIKSGEENKTLATCGHIWQELTDMAFDRKALVINLGGGVIGDMGGFCASTYKRGIDFIQIPTTLLSQVDASVGGKLGVDFNELKNHIGVFRRPNAVLINTEFLKTLDPREVRSGYAEVIKHCLIADKDRWDRLKQKGLEEQDFDELVEHSIKVKADITTADPLEKGLRKILNFGHTIGHAVESFYLPTEKKLLHGEAIAVGMIAEAYLSFQRGFITEEDCQEITDYILSIYGKVEIPVADYEHIVPLTLQDKKNEGGTVLASLLDEIGKANFNQAIGKEDIEAGLNYYRRQ